MSKWFTGGTAALVVAFAIASAVAPLHAQQTSGLTLPFSSTGTGTAGAAQLSGILHIAQFTELNGQAFAAGTLSVSVPNQSSGTTGSSVVTDVVVPVVSITSGSTALNLSSVNTSGATAGNTFASSTQGVTAGVGFLASPAAPIGRAGVPTSVVPGQVATCGPIHLVVGPIDVNQPSLVLHLDRLAVDVASTPGVASPLNDTVCSAEAALSQASTASSSTGTATQPSSVSTPTTPTGTATVGTAGTVGTMGTVGTTATTMGMAGTTATTAAAAQPLTPLQNVVALLNQLLGTL